MLAGDGTTVMARSWTETNETKDFMHCSHCLAGVINSEDVFGRRKRGSISWDGLPSLMWWIDRESGIAATFSTQLCPVLHSEAQKLLIELETALYRMVEAGKS